MTPMTEVRISQSCPSCGHEATSHEALGCVVEGCRCARTRRAMHNMAKNVADIVIARFRAEEPECGCGVKGCTANEDEFPGCRYSEDPAKQPHNIATLAHRRRVAEEAWLAGDARKSWPSSFDEWWDETGSKL